VSISKNKNNVKRGEKMKLKRKKSLSQRHIKKQTKELIEIGTAPLIGVSITIADGAAVTTTSKAISLLCDALGEDKAVNWHSKYMDKFEKLANKCCAELLDIVEAAKAEKLKNEQ
jgi:hypothetical protein